MTWKPSPVRISSTASRTSSSSSTRSTVFVPFPCTLPCTSVEVRRVAAGAHVPSDVARPCNGLDGPARDSVLRRKARRGDRPAARGRRTADETSVPAHRAQGDGMEESELFDDDGRIRADDESPLLLERLHRALAWWNVRRLRAEQPTRRWRDENEEDLRMRSLEGEWIEGERAALAPWIREVPRTSGGFLRWFESLQLDRHGHRDAMPGSPAGPVTLDEVRWWMRQELAASSGLEAVMALLRLRLPDLPEVARAGPAAGRERLARLGRAVGVETEGHRAV